MMCMENAIETLLVTYKTLVVYGAGGVAKATCRLLKECCAEKKVCVVVTDSNGNPKTLEGVTVYPVNSLTVDRYRDDILFIIAIMPISAEAVRKELHTKGYKNVMTAGELVEGMYRFFYKYPINRGKILFVNFAGRGYGCNPKYICEELLRRDLDTADCVWAVHGEAEVPERVRTVPYGSYRYYYELATAQVWIDNQHKDFFTRKREGQFYVQTWHGCGPLKKIEHDASGLPDSYLELSDRDMKMVDICLSGAGFNSMLFRRAFRYEGDILEYGCPRNDIFFRENFSVTGIRTALGIGEGFSVILYAPTLREGESNRIEVDYLLEACERLYTNRCVVLIREHPQMEMRTGKYMFSDRVIDVSDYPDMQEIMVAADMLITDYSSVMWDFSLQKKPVFLYHPDLQAYEEERGVYIPFSEMPYIETFSMEDLYKKICCYDDMLYQQKLEKFLQKYRSFDKGEASKAVVDKIEEVIKNGSERYGN